VNLLSTGELIFHVGDETAADDDALGDVTADEEGKPISSITALLVVLDDAIASVGNKSPLTPSVMSRGRGDDMPEADGRLSKEILLE
jgi:hypothetical protein